MDTLNKVVRKYLDENGISDKFFEKYISSTVLKYSKSTLIFDGVTPYLVVSHNQ